MPYDWLPALTPWGEGLVAAAWLVFVMAGGRRLGAWLLHVLQLQIQRGKADFLWRISLETTVGIGLFCIVWLWLALGGLFRFWILAGLLGMTFMLGRHRRTETAGEPAGSRRFSPAWWLLPFFVFPALLNTLVPELGFDAHRIHLWFTRALAEQGSLPVDVTNWFSFVPNLAAVWFALSYQVAGEVGAKMANMMLGLLAAGLLAGFWRSRLHRPGGSWAALFFLSFPVVAWEMGSAYIDLAITLYVWAALACLLQWDADQRDGWLVTSAICFGLALLSKYNALLWVPFLGGAIVWMGWRRRLAFPAQAGRLILFGGIALLVALPWYAHNLVHTGNPLFPLPLTEYPSPFLSENIVAAIRADQLAIGHGRDLTAALLLPIRLVITPEAFRGSPGLLIVLAIPLLWLSRRREPGPDGFLALAFLYWLVIWFITAQEIRYFMPVLPVAAWLSVRPLTGEGAGWNRVLRRGWAVLLALHLLLHSVPVYRHVFPEVGYVPAVEMERLRVAAGIDERREFLATHVPWVPVIEWANDHLQPPVRILCFYPVVHWSRWPTVYAMSAATEFTGFEREPDRLWRYCRQAGLTHVIVNTALVGPEVDLGKVPIFFDPRFQQAHLRLVYEQNRVKLFALPGLADEPRGGQSMLSFSGRGNHGNGFTGTWRAGDGVQFGDRPGGGPGICPEQCMGDAVRPPGGAPGRGGGGNSGHYGAAPCFLYWGSDPSGGYPEGGEGDVPAVWVGLGPGQ